MRNIPGTLLAVLMVLTFSLSALARDIIPFTDEMVEEMLVRGNNSFAFELFREVAVRAEGDNIFFSPYSISSALAMAYVGAEGYTAQDMAEVLHFTFPVPMMNQAFKSVMATMNSGSLQSFETGDPFTLTVSNGLWVEDGFNLLESYVSDVVEYYEAGVENLNFSGDPNGSREIINDWVAEKTFDKILDLLPMGVITVNTRVVLTNAVYFNASWQHPFHEGATSDGRFILQDGSTVVTPMMTQTEFFDYTSNDQWSAISMGYVGSEVSMIIILPEGDMDEFLPALNLEMLEGLKQRMSRQNVHLTMPSFEFTRSMPLSSILSLMGMSSAFGSGADFSGITGNPDLYISEVIHKAFVKVDEEGTEAAAATALVMNTASMPAPPAEMNINRPFIFLIQDNETGSIIFMGRVMNPSE